MFEEPEVWQYFNEGNFSVNKSSFLFVATGVDHGMEQENRTMKVAGNKLSSFILKLTEFTLSLSKFVSC